MTFIRPRALCFIGALAAVALTLAGCQATLSRDITTFNAAAANDMPTACALVASANAAFQTLAMTGTIKANVISTEKQAYAGASSICVSPGSVNAATGLETLTNAYAAIVAARQATTAVP